MFGGSEMTLSGIPLNKIKIYGGSAHLTEIAVCDVLGAPIKQQLDIP